MYQGLGKLVEEVKSKPEFNWRRSQNLLVNSTDDTSKTDDSILSPILSALGSRLVLRGALISPNLDTSVSHIIVDPTLLLGKGDNDRKDLITSRLRELRFQPDYRIEKRIVSYAWGEYIITKNDFRSYGGSNDDSNALDPFEVLEEHVLHL